MTKQEFHYIIWICFGIIRIKHILVGKNFDETLKIIFKREAWIMDGDYSRTMEMRMRACDTIILFDLPSLNKEAVFMEVISHA